MKSISRRAFLGTVGAGAALAGVAGLAGCSSNANSGSSTESTESSVATVEVNWDTEEDLAVALLGKDIKIACLVIALQNGYFEEEKLNVTTEVVANLSDGITAVSENKLDVLPFGVIPTCTFVGNGVENVCVFGGTVAEGSECIVKAENKDKYKTIEDFAGANIGYFPMETGHLVMQGLAKDAGVEATWTIYSDSNSAIEGVKKGEFDCAFVNSGQGYIAKKQSELDVAMQPGDLKPDFPCCRQSTSMDALENKASALVKFMVAELRGYALMKTDKEAAIKALVDYSGQDEAYVENVIFGTDDYDAAMIIELDPYTDAVCDFYEVMKQTENITSGDDYSMEDHVDSSIYRTALDEMISRGENADIWAELDELYKSHNTIGK